MGQGLKSLNFSIYVNILDSPVIQSVDYAFCKPYGSKNEDLVFVVNVNMEAATRIYSPVPLSFTSEYTGLLDLTLYFDNQVFKEVRNLSGTRFLLECITIFIFATVFGKMGKQLEQ